MKYGCVFAGFICVFYVASCGKPLEKPQEEPPEQQTPPPSPPPLPSPSPAVKPVQPKAPPAVDPNKSKRQWIHFYEGAIRDLEKKLTTRTDKSGVAAIRKEIDENNRRIAKLKAELGE